MTTTNTINLEPTPAGYKHMARIFAESIQRSRALMQRADALMGDLHDGKGIWANAPGEVCDLVEAALEALHEVECSRIVAMESGLAEVAKVGAKP